MVADLTYLLSVLLLVARKIRVITAGLLEAHAPPTAAYGTKDAEEYAIVVSIFFSIIHVIILIEPHIPLDNPWPPFHQYLEYRRIGSDQAQYKGPSEKAGYIEGHMGIMGKKMETAV